MKTNRRFVIDTNTTDILSEYEEIISDKYSATVARNVIRTLLLLPNVIQVNVYYNWNLIRNDRDDDKFVDCAIASNADAIITHDKHFNILENISFPSVKIMNVSKFDSLYKSMQVRK